MLFEDNKTFEDIGVMDKQWLVATEVLTEAGKQLIQRHHSAQAKVPLSAKQNRQKDTQLLRIKDDYSTDETSKESIISISQIVPGYAESSPPKNEASPESSLTLNTAAIATQTSSFGSQRAQSAKSGVIATNMYFNLFYKNKTPTCDLLPNYHPPSELIIMVINRKLVLYPAQQKLLKKHDPIAFATEFPILATESTSGRELYEQVWMRVRGMLQLAVHDMNLLWWTDKNSLKGRGGA